MPAASHQEAGRQAWTSGDDSQGIDEGGPEHGLAGGLELEFGWGGGDGLLMGGKGGIRWPV